MAFGAGAFAGENEFRLVHEALSLPFVPPAIPEYEEQKGIRVVKDGDEVCLSHFRCPCFHPAAGAPNLADRSLSRSWSAFFGRRIHAASIGGSMRIVSYFPGHTVPGPGCAHDRGLARYRGSLLFDQFRQLMGCGTWPPRQEKAEPAAAVFTPLQSGEPWAWTSVPRPPLYLLEAVSGEPGAAGTGEADLRALSQRARVFASCGRRGIDEMLSAVHAAWTVTQPPRYCEQALEICAQVWSEKRRRVRDENILPLLFELEGFASFMTFSQKLRLVAQGIFAGNWLEVGLASLSECRGTELCVRERLLEEVLNLPRRRFAPLVVNEYGLVADGNHRLTACWIWNILNACANYDWSLSSAPFQGRVGEFVAAHGAAMGELTVHEALSHLAAFLGDSSSRRRLAAELKPYIGDFLSVSDVPVVLLPEYLSGAVVKAQYDEGVSTVRVDPAVFERMAKQPGATLPARASYHFTDCAPLPWFSILVPAGRIHAVPPGARRRSHRHGQRSLSVV